MDVQALQDVVREPAQQLDEASDLALVVRGECQGAPGPAGCCERVAPSLLAVGECSGRARGMLRLPVEEPEPVRTLQRKLTKYPVKS